MINTKRKCKFGKIIITVLMILFIMIATPNYVSAKENTTKLGDIDGNQQIDISDLVLILRHISAKKTNKNEKWILKEEQIKIADVTGDNEIDSSDVLVILRYIAAKKSDEVAKKHKEWLEIRKEENRSEETEKEPVQEETKPEEPEKTPAQEETKPEEPEKTPTQEEIPNKEEEKIAPEKIELNQSKITITKNETIKLIAKITPETVNINQEVTWSSSNIKIVTVDNKGIVTAKGEGTANITVKTGNGKTASCTVTVKEPIVEVTGIKLNKTSVNMEKGNGERLTATVEPANATNKTITWSSSNKNVATVNKEGFITAKRVGTTIITTKTANGKIATCTITVKKPVITATGITINISSLTIEKGETKTLKATILPKNTTKKNITWSSSNIKVAKVDSNGKITAVGGGTATITAKTSNNLKAKCKVTVKTVTARNFLNQIQIYSDQVKKDYKEGKYWYYGNANKYRNFTTAAKNGIRQANCATLTIWALKDLGVIPNNAAFNYAAYQIYTSKTAVNASQYLGKYGQRLTEYRGKNSYALAKSGKLKEGDICIYTGHINVYAGNLKWYEAGRVGSNGKTSYRKDSNNQKNYQFTTFGPCNYGGSTLQYIFRFNE